ncbi:MAG: protein kinase [Planctomycetota bacterium]
MNHARGDYTSPPMDQAIGPYSIEREIGRGGMGVVYLARDPRLDRAVAIKALPDEVASDPARLERFEREAKALAQLNHPNIAGIHGIEEQESRRYLVLEYVEGETLADQLDRGPIGPDEAIELACQIARGIAAAHDAGIVHRDLKPANIKITPEGEAKVLDFGLARDEGGTSTSGISEAATLTSPVQHSPTTPGVILGTAAYMSPEQARGRRVDKRTDIWSFGVVLYEMLTGASPFVGETATDSIGAILHKETDLGLLPVNTPQAARRVLRRCLARDRNERYHDISDARLELESPADIEPMRSEVPRKGGLLPAVVAALLFGAGGLAVGVVALAPEAPQVVRQPRIVSIPTPDDQIIHFAAAIPDGSGVIAWIQDPAEPFPRVMIRRLDESEWRPVEGVDGSVWMDVSPDRTAIILSAPVERGSTSYRLMHVELNSNLPATELAPLPASLGPSYKFRYHSNDQIVLFGDPPDQNFRILNPNSGEFGPTIEFEADVSEFNIEPWTSIDETQILVNTSRYTDRGYQVDVGVLDIETAEFSILIPNGNNPWIAPDGAIVFSRNDRLFRAEFDGVSLEVGPPVQLATGFRTSDPWEAAEFSLTEDGSVFSLPGGIQGAERTVAFLSADGTAETWPVGQRAFTQGVAASFDEQRAVVNIGGASGLFELWGSEIDRARLRRLHGRPLHDIGEGRFFPDNRFVLCTVQTDSGSWLEIVDFEGVQEPLRPTGVYEDANMTTFVQVRGVHPDGDRALVLERDSGARLVEIIFNEDRTQATRRVLFSGGANTVSGGYSPDGSMLAYASDETGRPEAYVRSIRADGSLGPAEPVTVNGGLSAIWQQALDTTGDTYTLTVTQTGGVYEYQVKAGGARPEVSDGSLYTSFTIDPTEGRGTMLSDGRYLTILQGENEARPTQIDVRLDWYDHAVAELTDR